MPTPCDVLVRGGFLVRDPASGDIVENGGLAIQGDTIVACGPLNELRHYAPREEIDGSAMVALPGIINGHTHLASCIFRGLFDEGAAGLGLYRVAFPVEQRFEPEDIYWLGLLGAVEVLKAGCTTVNDIYFFASTLAAVVEQVGLRAVLAEKVYDVDLPRIGAGDYTRFPERGQARLEANLDLIARWHGAANGRITCRIGTHATDTCSPALLRQALREAEQAGVGLHMHVAQTAVEVEHIRAAHGLTPIEYLDDLGILGPWLLAAHCTFASDNDLERFARAGARYTHTPTIYPRRGRYPKVWEFLRRGIPTAYGTDWIRMDPWEGMRLSLSVARVVNQDPELLPAATLLHHFTAGAAEALGLERIGRLLPGYKADVALVRLDRPHLQPFWGTLAGLVYNANAQDVDTVLVDGRVLLRGGRCQTVDEEALWREVERRIPRWRGWLESARR